MTPERKTQGYDSTSSTKNPEGEDDDLISLYVVKGLRGKKVGKSGPEV